MGQFSKVLLAIDSHSMTKGPELQTMHRWVKPGSWAQLSHSICLEYLGQIYQHLYRMYK